MAIVLTEESTRVEQIAAWRQEKGLLIQVKGTAGFYLADRADTIRSFRDERADFIEPTPSGWRLFKVAADKESARDEIRRVMEAHYAVLRGTIA